MLIAAAGGDDEMDRLIRVIMEGDSVALRKFSTERMGRDRDQLGAEDGDATVQQLFGRMMRTLALFHGTDGSKADSADLWDKGLSMLQGALALFGLQHRDREANVDRPEAATTESKRAGRDRAGNLVNLVQAVNQLERRDPLLAQAVDLRLFGGMSMPDIAEVLGVPLRPLQRSWQNALRDLRDGFS